MLEVGGRPILEHLIERLTAQGFKRIFISVNYLGEYITNYFGDGSKWGVDIQYVREGDNLGTAGALRLLPADIKYPLLVMNGDIMVDLDLKALVAFHESRRWTATMCVRDYSVTIPYGVVCAAGSLMTGIREKPMNHSLVNAGIYVLSKEAVEQVPQGHFDMPQLFENLLEQGLWPGVYKIDGSWADIGRPEDVNWAQRVANNV